MLRPDGLSCIVAFEAKDMLERDDNDRPLP